MIIEFSGRDLEDGGYQFKLAIVLQTIARAVMKR